MRKMKGLKIIMKNRKISSIFCVVSAVLIVMTIIPLVACDGLETIFAWYELNFENTVGANGFQVVLNKGETFIVGEEHFAFTDSFSLNFNVVELETFVETKDNVVVFNGSTITALNNGRAEIKAKVSGTREVHNTWLDEVVFENVMWGFVIGEVIVIDEKNMTEIWDAYDLDDIRNDLGGSFILRADIDLSCWDNWTPIGSIGGNFAESPYAFSGIFINGNDYAISNLTIVGDSIRHVGLFGFVKRAYIAGIKLNDVYIRATCGDLAGNFVGAVAGQFIMSWIENIHVSGTIVGGPDTGGIIGLSLESKVVYNSFNGTIEATTIAPNRVNAGGIIGVIGQNLHRRIWNLDLIKNNRVIATINGDIRWSNVGGIVGGHESAGISRLIIRDNIFTGYLTGFRVDEIVAWIGSNH